ncbi:hypothetical protein [Xanthovirga aplysinae]|uniref:hypothetical protein n=1 Tax=Xanthovirga aplysinae TaxID=2529853 RepID=UPI0012BD81AD|nr:hypothetical protein [Xanthovirga aplysinae]MTI31602.1 hypothetical protein [Xanthovirga aplysinae]
MTFLNNFNLQLKHCYFLGGLILFLTAFFSAGFHHLDEHFQILEYAGLKVGTVQESNLAWEYHYQIRPAIQPFIATNIYRSLGFVGIKDPFIVAFFLRLLSALLTFLTMRIMYKAFVEEIKDKTLKHWFAFLTFFLWIAIYNGVRFSSENWSGALIIIALGIFKLNKTKDAGLKDLFIGLLLGLAFIFRFQAGFLILGFLLWLLIINRSHFQNLLLIGVGLIVSIGFGVLIDRWFYNEWVITAWNYLNKFFDKDVSDFGESPWWYYLNKVFFELIPPFSLLFLLAPIVFFIFKPKNIITWTVFPFLLVHFLIGHKESRFLFPLIGFLPIMVIYSLQILKQRWKQGLFSSRWGQRFSKGFFIFNILFLILITFRPANSVGLYQLIYRKYKEPISLYYLENNPFVGVTDIYLKKPIVFEFYMGENLHLQKTDLEELKTIRSDQKYLLVVRDKEIVTQLPGKNRLIYSTYPEWLRNFNINNWISRTRWRYLYEIDNTLPSNLKVKK